MKLAPYVLYRRLLPTYWEGHARSVCSEHSGYWDFETEWVDKNRGDMLSGASDIEVPDAFLLSGEPDAGRTLR